MGTLTVSNCMQVGTLPQDVVFERLMDARRTYKLNLGYAGLTTLPPGFVEMVKKFNPHITELELSSNNITDLPDEIQEFRYLRILRLKYNQLRKLPAVVSRLPQLMVLELSGNQLTRVDDFIESMTMLKELDLSGNMLTHVSDALGSLPKLEILQLANNRLDILPETLGELPSLIKLDISTNSLRFLPASMGNLKKIQRLDCSNNLLARIPPSMGHLKFLKEFGLRYNSLDDRYKAMVEKGLSRLLAFLREEEERERLEEIERLKPIGTPVGAYLEYRCKVEVGQVHKTEHGEITVDNRCWIRTGHTLTQVGNMLVIFGGQLAKDGSTTNDLFWMTIDRMEWHLQPAKGDKPQPRYNHCALYDEDNNRLVVFGGRNAERKRLNDIHFLDLNTFVWYKPACEGTAPTPREQPAVTLWAGSMVVFGGYAVGGRTNDLFVLDLSSWQWSQPATAGTAPSPRQASAICIGHSNLLIVHGGRNNFVLEDLHVLDFVTKTWAEISATGRMPPPRHSHLICMHKSHIYLYGGLDGLGAQSFAMYCMFLPPGENYAVLRPEWVEWDSELPYNKCRTATFFNGSISIYQLGSTTLGRVNDEDAEKGLVYWDVLKACRLDSLKARALVEEELKPKNAKRMRVQHAINIAAKMPRTFNMHTPAESKVMAYVQDFQRSFEELYPYRRPLYLTPRNECNVPKLVCTTIRPTQLMYTELYDLHGCAAFVADFLAFEPLEDPLHPPEFLPSPMNTLAWQAGDTFDMSAVLCSLLLGVGYNAYVVVGYAPQAMVVNDQTKAECTALERVHAKEGTASAAPVAKEPKASKKQADKEEKPAEEKKPKYVVKPPNALTSAFLQAQEAKRAAEEAEEAAKAAAEPSADTPIPVDPVALNGEEAAGAGAPAATAAQAPGVCRTVHAWVLVMAGKRDIVEPLFIETTTGRKYTLKDSPYEGVEYLWNHRNFWVCMQMALPHSDSRAHPKDISFDLTNPSKWEAVFEDRSARVVGDVTADESELRGMEYKGVGRATRQSKSGPKASMLMTGGATQTMGRQSKAGTTGDTPPRTAESHADSHASGEDGDGPEQDLVPEIPPSWVPKMTIPRDAFDMRCPRGSKLTLYKKCQHEIFALFGDSSRWDGMVEKIVAFEDEDRTIQTEVVELFERRKDKLCKRETYPQKDTNCEYFHGGSSFGLKDILTIKNERRAINFYHTARLDGLMRREEIEGHKIIETFTNRDDLLIYRSATYVNEAPDAVGFDDDASKRASRKARTKDSKKMLPIRKMTEKFARNDKVPAEQDVAKRVFYLAEGRIRVDHHYGEGRVTRSGRVFHKDGQSQIVQVDPLAPQPEPGVLLEEYQALVAAEKDCVQAIRDSEWEFNEIVRTRTNQEQNITLETPYYDVVRIKAEESEEEEEEKAEAQYDYLSPFLPALIGVQQLSREQAFEVREKALKALKDRLIERANIIQARLDEEQSALAKRQQNFARDRDQMSHEEEEEYERAMEESQFRVHILEKRLKRHEEQALHKYYELDHKLRSDARLASLLS